MAAIYPSTCAIMALGSMKDEYDFSTGRRGAMISAPAETTRVSLRIDDDVLEWFRQRVHAAGGGDYQALISAALRDHIARTQS